jgi:hypothetical protein
MAMAQKLFVLVMRLLYARYVLDLCPTFVVVHCAFPELHCARTECMLTHFITGFVLHWFVRTTLLSLQRLLEFVIALQPGNSSC